MKDLIRRDVLPLIVLGLLVSCDSISVATWNVQNLFDPVEQGREYAEFRRESSWSQDLYHRRLDRIARGVLEMTFRGPDVLIFQEIENRRVLEDLAEGPLRSASYRYSTVAPGLAAVRVGALSRYPISQVRGVEVGDWEGRPLRSLLGFTVDLPRGPVRLYGLHWKSRRDGAEESEEARRREAAVLVQEVLGYRRLEPRMPIYILGDFNSSDDLNVADPALFPVSQGDLFTQVGLCGDIDGEVLELVDLLPSEEGSYWFRDRWERLDRVLSYPVRENPSYLAESVHIHTGSMVNEQGRPFRWVTKKGEGFSDHLPVVLTLAWVD